MSVLALDRVSVADGGPAVLAGVDLVLEPGERLVLFGSSGSGKRALLKTLAGILRPAAGTLRLGDEGRPCPVGWVPREGGLLNNETLLANVTLPALYHRIMDRDEARRRGLRLLAELGVESQAGLRPAAAPLAARRLAQLARALLCEPALYVLESPFDEMDAHGAAAVRSVLERIRADGRCAAVLGTASPGPYLGWGGRFAMIQGGRLRSFGGRDALLADPDPELKTYLS
jgi:ABC-type multidrug transport system ATPase subunit